MGERQRKLRAGGQDPKVWGISFGLASLALIVVTLTQRFLVLHGLEDKTQRVEFFFFSFQFPVLLLPVIGVVALLVSSWVYVAEEGTSYRPQGGRAGETAAIMLRFLNTALFLAAILSIAMLGPYLLGSVILLRALGWISRLIPLAEPGAMALADRLSTFGNLDELAKYCLSIVGTSVLVLIACLLMTRRKSRRSSPKAR